MGSIGSKSSNLDLSLSRARRDFLFRPKVPLIYLSVSQLSQKQLPRQILRQPKLRRPLPRKPRLRPRNPAKRQTLRHKLQPFNRGLRLLPATGLEIVRGRMDPGQMDRVADNPCLPE